MLRNIIVALVGFVVIGLLILWIFNGGPSRAYSGLKNFTSSASSTGGFVLPWRTENLVPLITEKDLFPDGTESSPTAPDATVASLNNEYENIEKDARALINNGNPSPYFGKVVISETYSNPREGSVSKESISLGAAYDNTAPISLAGWSLQSAVSGVYVQITGAASPFWMGAVNTLVPVSLSPGASAILTTGDSPVGVSFKENKCIGYLAQFQSFEPSLSLRCPSPHEEVVLSEQNLQRYGTECEDVLQTIPPCEFPKELPAVSPACRAHLQTILSYNGCVSGHMSDSDFPQDSWRLFLSSRVELWKNTHDAIRLLDASGKVVDVYVY